MNSKLASAFVTSSLCGVHPFLHRPPSFWESILHSIFCPGIIFQRNSSDPDKNEPSTPPGDAAEK